MNIDGTIDVRISDVHRTIDVHIDYLMGIPQEHKMYT